MLKMRKAWLALLVVGLSLLAVGVAWAASGSFTDTSIANFNAGAGTCLVSPSAGDAGGDGEVVLGLDTGGMLETFSGSFLPSTWISGTYGGGSASLAVGGDLLTLNGYWASSKTSVSAPRVLEFVATFGPGRQHAGFGSFDLNSTPWAIFSTVDYTTNGYGGQLYARTRDLTNPETSSPLGSTYLGNPHRYRIEWTATQVAYYIDGGLVATHNSPTISTPMYPVVSDPADNDGTSLVVDWMRMGPYNTSCTYTSQVFDKGTVAYWDTMTSTLNLPTGTSAAFQVRFATTVTPTADWTSWLTPAGTNGTGGIRRPEQYMQYQVTLNTSNAQITPVVSDVWVNFSDTPTAVTMQSLTARSAGTEVGLVLPVGLILATTAGYVVLRKRRRSIS
jgi:hypothetical protein